MKGNPVLYKSLVVGIIALFIFMSITPSVAVDNVKKSSIPISSGNTLYVGGTGPGNYTKIQDAIDNASDGDTVFVFSGSYYEGVRIRKQINLIGEDKNTTIIEAENRHNAIILYDEYIGISGFTINNTNDWSDDCGIEIQNAWGTHTTHNTITDNIFKNHKSSAINVYESSYNTIKNNLIIKSGGISTGSYCSYNDISNNIFIGSGISVWGDPKYTTISGNHITKGGITVSRGKNNKVEYNVIENGSNIIIKWETSNNVVENNILISSGSIILDESTGSNVRYNTFTDSEGITIKGKKLQYWNTHIIESNVKNGRPIYYYKDENNALVPHYTAQVIMANCNSCSIKDLDISDVQYGIQIAFSSKINISSNICKRILYSAINCYESSYLTITNNIINNNSRTGIMISGNSSRNDIGNNHITKNTDGITISVKSFLNLIHNNNISENKEYGVYISGSENEIYENVFKQNKKGLFLYFSCDNLIFKNNFIKNSMYHAFYKVDYQNAHDNKWKRNYYDDTSLLLLKLIWGRVKTRYHWSNIYGETVYFFRTGVNIDLRPALLPHKISTMQGCDIL